MKVLEQYKHLQELFNKGYRMNPEIKTFYVRKEDYNNFKLPDNQQYNEDFSTWKVEVFEQTQYVKKRLEQMGLSKSPQVELIDENGNKKMHNLLSCNRYGDLIAIQYAKNRKKLKNKYGKDAYQQRINDLWAEILCEKYNFTNIVNYPLFHPQLIEKEENKIKIPTLILTEGYLKALLPNELGMNMIALGSITHHSQNELIQQEITTYADLKKLKLSDDELEEIEYNEELSKWVKKEIHADIASLCVNCSVDRIVVLWDGDCRNISLKDLKKGDNINSRPNKFYQNALTIARRLNKAFKQLGIKEMPKIYFTTIKSNEIQGNPKGIDDLFIQFLKNEETTKEIKYDLNNIGIIDNSKYFEWIDISKVTTKESVNKELYHYFFLDDVNRFYQYHKECIKSNTFKFNDIYYQYDSLKEKVIERELKDNNRDKQKENTMENKTKRFDYNNFIQIDNKYYRVVEDQFNGQYQYEYQSLKQWNANDIIREIGRKELKLIPFYEDEVYQPLPPNQYQQNFRGRWNTYPQIKHKIISKHFDDIQKLLKQLFPNPKHYKMVIEYLAVLMQRPTQKLPVLTLVSKEQNTGKSTFIFLCKLLFQENATLQTMLSLNGHFNISWAKSLVVLAEEIQFNEKDGNIYITIKITTTAKTIPVEGKHENGMQSACHTHFIFATNKEEEFIKLDPEDTRFLIFKVPGKVKKENYIDNLHQKLIEQVGAFAQYLLNYKLEYKNPEINRLYFRAEDIMNEFKVKVMKESRPQIIQDLIHRVKEYFDTFPQENELMIKTSDFFRNPFQLANVYKIGTHKLTKEIKEHLPQIEQIKYPIKYTFLIENNENINNPIKYPSTGRVFIFNREQLDTL